MEFNDQLARSETTAHVGWAPLTHRLCEPTARNSAPHRGHRAPLACDALLLIGGSGERGERSKRQLAMRMGDAVCLLVALVGHRCGAVRVAVRRQLGPSE